MVSKTCLASCMLARSGLGALMRRTGGHHGFLVLNYHRLGDPMQTNMDRLVFSATQEMFAQQLAFLKAECDLITPDEIRDLPRRRRGIYALLTFDDGYRDNYTIAFPTLKDARVKAVFFLATGFLDCPRMSWWDEIAWMVNQSRCTSVGPLSLMPTTLYLRGDRQDAIWKILATYKKLPGARTLEFMEELSEALGVERPPAVLARDVWMTWDMVREMDEAGMTFGGHTVNHPVLSRISRQEQEREIGGCARALQQNLGKPMRLFSYPRGKPDAYNEDTRACLYEAQVQYAFTYYGGMNHTESMDPYDVRRVAVDGSTQFEHFEAMLTLPRLFA